MTNKRVTVKKLIEYAHQVETQLRQDGFVVEVEDNFQYGSYGFYFHFNRESTVVTYRQYVTPSGSKSECLAELREVYAKVLARRDFYMGVVGAQAPHLDNSSDFYCIHKWDGTDEMLEDAWRQLEDVTFSENEDGALTLLSDWFVFEKGTLREAEIWTWFDQNHSKGVGWLTYKLDENPESVSEVLK